MRKRNALLLAAVSVFALTMATTTNAAYRCTWTDGVKVCGNELGFAPSVGGDTDRRDTHSGDRESSGGPSASGSSSSEGGSEGGPGSNGNGGGPGSNAGGGNGPEGGDPGNSGDSSGASGSQDND